MVWPFYLKGRCGKGFFHPKVYTTEALRPDQSMLTSPDEFASRCREIAKDNELGAALRDCGIDTFEEFYHTFRAKDRDLTDEEFTLRCCRCSPYGLPQQETSDPIEAPGH